MDQEPGEAARQKIDAEILKLRIQIAKLSTIRNSLAPISRLDPELLIIIWIYARNSSPISSKSKMAMTISWVSGDWRRISLNWSWLWSDIDFDHTNGVRAFLARSQQAPLVLRLQLERSMGPAVSGQLHRAQDVHFSYGVNDTDPEAYIDLARCWSSPSPALDTLSLTRTNLPPILSTHSSSLRSLSLTGCAFGTLSPLSGLTTLAISRPTQLFLATDFLGTLQRLPNLVNLSLDHVFSGTISPFTSPPVQLPKLQALNIAEPDRDPILHLFQNVSIPGTTETTLTISPAVGEFNSPDVLTSYQACRTSPSPIHTLAVTRSILASEVRTSSEIKILEQSPHSSTSTTIFLGHAFDFNPFTQSSTLNLSSLQRLDLTLSGGLSRRHRRPGISEDDWTTFYGNLPNLRVVKAAGFAAYLVLDILAKEGRNAQSSYKDLLPPALQPEPVSIPDLDEGDTTPPSQPESSAPQPRMPLSWKALRELTLIFPAEGTLFTRDAIDGRHLLVDLVIRKEIGIGLTCIWYSSWPTPSSARFLKEVVDDVLELEP